MITIDMNFGPCRSKATTAMTHPYYVHSTRSMWYLSQPWFWHPTFLSQRVKNLQWVETKYLQNGVHAPLFATASKFEAWYPHSILGHVPMDHTPDNFCYAIYVSF